MSKMSTLKTFGVVVVMLTCFAIVYPRFMHPLVMRALGLNEPIQKDANDKTYPPSNRNLLGRNLRPQPPPDDAQRHTRSIPHPGMRAAVETQKQQSSDRGMMGMVLPMYAIGIVLYLIYTVFKVFNKPSKNSWSDQMPQYDNTYVDDVDRYGFPPAAFDDAGQSIFNNQYHRRQLENLLGRVDDKNMSVDDMRILQKRLEETEAEMTKILRAMQSAQTKVDRRSTPQDADESKFDSHDLGCDKEGSEVVVRRLKAERRERDENTRKAGPEIKATPSDMQADDSEAEEQMVEDPVKSLEDIEKVVDDKDSEEDKRNESEEIEANTDDSGSPPKSISHVRRRKVGCDNEQ